MTTVELKREFKRARQVIDAISGTGSIYRTVENSLFYRPPRQAAHVGYDALYRERNKHAEYELDVRSIATILNMDGTFTDDDGTCHSGASRIADVLLMSGLSWVNKRKVQKAQERLR